VHGLDGFANVFVDGRGCRGGDTTEECEDTEKSTDEIIE
jgi:hypothetical protein